MSRVSFLTVCFTALFLTYLVVASLVAFFTVKIIGVPIGKRMFTKIVLSIVSFIPLYILIAYLLSKLVSRDLSKLSKAVRDLPFNEEMPRSRITEIDELSGTISLQSGRIREMMEAQRFMLYRIAHDLRTPLTNLRNVLLAMEEGLIGEGEKGSYLRKLIRETERMESLLEDALSSVRKISRRLEPERVNLCEFFRDVEYLWRVRFEKKGIGFSLECEGDFAIEIPLQDLEEIVNNLLENAYRNTEKGEVKVRVSSTEDRVIISFEDTGGGISTPRLQEAYRRGSLGLYIVRELTWKNGGRIEIGTSEKGTSVRLFFKKSRSI